MAENTADSSFRVRAAALLAALSPGRLLRGFGPSQPPQRAPFHRKPLFEALEQRLLMAGDAPLADLLLGATAAADPAVNARRIEGAISAPGEVDTYAFRLTKEALVQFDGLSADSTAITWTLAGPRRIEVSGREILADDQGPTRLPAGDYVLSIDAGGDVTGSYAFRLLDLAQGHEVFDGVRRTGTLDPANETDVYRFEASAGEQVFLDLEKLAGQAPAMRIVDPQGQTFYRSTAFTDIDTRTLPFAGTYAVLVEGQRGSAGTTDYAFTLRAVHNDEAFITLGRTVEGAITTGQQDIYRFHVDQRTPVLFDGLRGDSSSIGWSLSGPKGPNNAGGAVADDGGQRAPLDLVSGDYTLTPLR